MIELDQGRGRPDAAEAAVPAVWWERYEHTLPTPLFSSYHGGSQDESATDAGFDFSMKIMMAELDNRVYRTTGLCCCGYPNVYPEISNWKTTMDIPYGHYYYGDPYGVDPDILDINLDIQFGYPT